MFRMRTLSQGEITGGGHDFLERLRLLDFPSVVSYNESNRDLILSQAMRAVIHRDETARPTSATIFSMISSVKSADSIFRL